MKKKKKVSAKKALTKKKGKTKSAEKEPIKVRKFPRIASKFCEYNFEKPLITEYYLGS